MDILKEDIQNITSIDIPWERLKDKNVLITGATGMIGSFLVDVLMSKNRNDNLNCTIYALGRNVDQAQARFLHYWNSKNFFFIAHDMNLPLDGVLEQPVDFMLHLASNTHPVVYSTDPIGTITTNILGTNHLLNYAVKHGIRRFLLASSCEIYGENRGDTELFDESYCGYLNCNTLRAGYPESKRCAEALCQAFQKQAGIEIVIARLSRCFGPTMLMSDTKALSQFIQKGIRQENIILKSAGTQFYSYTYVADAVSGLLTVLLCGKAGEAYNISEESCDIMLRDLANMIATYVGVSVVFELPNDVEKAGYSTATKARLDGCKIKTLGWHARYNIDTGISRTLDALKIKNESISIRE